MCSIIEYLSNLIFLSIFFQASQASILSIALIVNEKFRERVPMWNVS